MVESGGGLGPVAVNSSGTVVVVMKTNTELVYTVGFCDPSTQMVQFGNPILPVYTWGNIAVSNFDVAMYDNQVVVVFEIGGNMYQLYYITGTLNGTTITWNQAVNYDQGHLPSVTINGNTVVEVHVTQENPQERLYYHAGNLNGATISNFDQGGIHFGSYEYSVVSTSCSYSNSGWLVVTVTGGPYEAVSVWYYTMAGQVGTFTPENQGNVTNGVTSSVALDFADPVEVHTPNPGVSVNENIIYLTTGWIDLQGGAINWNPSSQTTLEGSNPYVSLAGSFLVVTYMTLDDTGSTMAAYASIS